MFSVIPLFFLLRWVAATSDTAPELFSNTSFAHGVYKAYSDICNVLKSENRHTALHTMTFCLPFVTGMVKKNDSWVDEFYKGALILESPKVEGNEKVAVHFMETGVTRFDLIDPSNSIALVDLSLTVAWNDNRLRWDSNFWKFNIYPTRLTLHQHIWSPVLGLHHQADKPELLLDSPSYGQGLLLSNGNVTAEFTLEGVTLKCTTDLHRYPHDRHRCCYQFRVEPSESLRPFIDRNVFVGGISSTPSWLLEDARLSLQADKIEECIVVQRNKAAISTELKLPIVIIAVAFVCSQFLKDWKMQIYAKMFILLAKLVAFNGLMANTTLSSAAETPDIYTLYNFSACVIVISFTETVAAWILAERKFKLPPPHQLLVHIRFVNSTVCGEEEVKMEEDGRLSEHHGGSEWSPIFIVAHSTISLLLCVVYLFGIFTVCA